MKLQIVCLALIFYDAISLPINYNTKERKDDSGIPSKKPCQRPCYFSKPRTNDRYEKLPRPGKSVVSSECSGTINKMSKFFQTTLNSATGETNATALLLCRGAGYCDLDFSKPEIVSKWENVPICQKHGEELLEKWDDTHAPHMFRDKHMYRRYHEKTYKTSCSMPDSLIKVHYQGRPVDHLTTLTIQDADLLLKEKGILLHPGIPYCEEHKKFLTGVKETAKTTNRERTPVNYADADVEMDACIDDPPYIQSEPINQCLAVSALQEFASAVGVDLSCSSRKPYSELKERCRQKKAVSLRKVVDSMILCIAPLDKEEFETRVFKKKFSKVWTTGSEKDLELIMEQISVYYKNSFDRKSKTAVLSLVADVLPHATVEKFIPGLSRYLYGEARKFSRRNRDAEIPEVPKIKESYNREAVENFISFITSPSVMIGLPYGVKKVKMSDGTKIEIPNSIRQQSSTEIFNMYNNLMEETGQTGLMLKKSTVFEILKVCSATTRTATTCVDYYIANGMEAFDGLHSMLDTWTEKGLVTLESLKELKAELYEAAQYLRTDYRIHVKKFSRIADHCATYALSDPDQPKLSLSCSSGPNRHVHDYKCEKCEKGKATFDQIKQFGEDLLAEAQEITTTDADSELMKTRLVADYQEQKFLIDKYINQVFEMKKHLLRAAVTNQEREEIISNLEDNEVLITVDFAQKYLPRWHREKQSDYFGKKGMSYHISHITARIGDNYTQHSFVHIYDGEVQQNSELVVLTLSHVVTELKKVGIKAVSIRSDNAGAYHCASTIASLHWLMAEFGIVVKSYSFSEAQNGKSSSDRDAARVKQKAARYVASGKDITTTKQFFEAIKSGTPLNGVSVYYGSTTADIQANAMWKGISSLNFFTVEKNGVRAHKYAGIGEGVFTSTDALQSLNGTFEFEGAGFIASGIDSIDLEREAVRDGKQTKFWFYSPKKCEKPACDDEPDDIVLDAEDSAENSMSDKALYSCPEPGCTASYLRESSLGKHMLRGVHKFLPERVTMRDYALGLFARGLEEVSRIKTSVLNAVTDALKSLKETTDSTLLTLGWALPSKQTRKPYPEDVKKFLLECFEKGLKNQKLNPATIGKLMAEATKSDGTKRFTVEQRLDVKQIAGFLSREAKKRQSGNGRFKRNDEATQVLMEDDEYDAPAEEVHPDSDWIDFMDEAQFWTEWDEFLTAIYDHPDPIFVY
ncbi:hypothetical protein CAEBREN_20165 [Caenorhabditis brenneri]|uniref:C2H2-type domain-containing protein n=1 Tax=Caenorhabditis brenneri TaxID=135651 RepID=G0N5W1_CAEBE|nr:hypothetical protein CAEBREN_20165 [Caenorhabditis brenneri]